MPDVSACKAGLRTAFPHRFRASQGIVTEDLGASSENDAARVLAVEAAPAAARLLRLNVLRNGLDNIQLFAGAAAEADGGRTLHTIDGLEEYASLAAIVHPSAAGATERRVEVPARTLDSLVQEHSLQPALLKIDVEGAEGLVLSGAKQLLAKSRPIGSLGTLPV